MRLDCTFEACDVCQELENLDSEQEVQTVQETLQKLSQKRIALNNSRNALHDRLRTKLPVELIYQIFVLVDKANNHSPDKRPPVLLEVYFCAPAILSSVCRRWREIALSLPELWTNVYINLRRKPDQVIEDWLKRSGSLLLNLTLYVNKDRKTEPLIPDSVCNIIRCHSARWQYLDVCFAATNTLYHLFNKLEIMPESDSFHLRLGEYYCPDQTISLDTPLRPRRFHSKTLLFFQVIPCDWTNLTFLELSRSLIVDVLNIIKAATKLKRCVSRKMHHSSIMKPTPVTHQVLEALELSFKGHGTQFFRNITLPSLRQLKYDTNIVHHDIMFHDLTNFLVRSEIQSSSLEIFSLAYHFLTLPNLDHSGFLELKGVTHLSIDIWHDSKIRSKPKIIEPLLLRMSDPSVFPHLQALRFKLKGDLHPDPAPALSRSVGRVRRPSTFLEPESYSALSNFITEHNAQLKSARDHHLEQGVSSGNTIDSILHPQRDPRYTSPTHDGMAVPYRPLISISFQKSDKVIYMAHLTTTETGPCLQESWPSISSAEGSLSNET